MNVPPEEYKPPEPATVVAMASKLRVAGLRPTRQRVAIACLLLDGRHRHVHLIQGRARLAQVYPREFSLCICRGIAAQKRLDRLGLWARPVMSLDQMLDAAAIDGAALDWASSLSAPRDGRPPTRPRKPKRVDNTGDTLRSVGPLDPEEAMREAWMPKAELRFTLSFSGLNRTHEKRRSRQTVTRISDER